MPFPLWLIAIGLVIYLAYEQYEAEAQKAKGIKTEKPDSLENLYSPVSCSCGAPAYYSDLWSKDAYTHGCIAEFTCRKGHIFTRVGEKLLGPR